MTVMLIPEQPTETVALDNDADLAQPEDNKAQLRKLAELLAQAYVAMPLFP